MYKHAWTIRNSKDERNKQEEEELGRVNPKTGEDISAAGCRPGTPQEFVEKVKNAITRYRKSTEQISSAGIATRLNRDNITNAIGGKWTATTARAFADYYIKQKPRF